ncbi:triple tyrosine motif-containing protein [Clostridium botulinum C]|uniref:Triple tyrosine motif-containing protein n=3 Tax=Clostridium botulinum TaxID=1491 RepID=A0A9Q4XWF8_CLOBO|nr:MULTISPECIES: triple tyrosine motif-containing protein [Clostridium]EGO88421.1 triple tyrosine motif-containing protein [Clostridium botulinum C str. Stockholm]AYF54245.1 triple tyrosine motif-containing protein [Clostridium novyi]EES92290.1 two component regulator three Y motif protein [Clostridium botulinum D str. 1873]MBO3441669.1 triple tyrosine motif-containing protein [Clostridium haemolyticum]MCD3195871.1 triple tyrosine motif-containing protein [Clostridium botulinum C]
MNEIIIGCNEKSPKQKDGKVVIEILSHPNEDLLYKFIVGYDGTWETLRDFSDEKSLVWCPQKQGSYIIMVQARKRNSNKAFDYVSRREFYLEKPKKELSKKIKLKSGSRLISKIVLDKNVLTIGEKLNVSVETKDDKLMFRYMINKNEKWLLLKDYCPEKNFKWSANLPGKYEILVQCKYINSEKNFEDAMKIGFEVKAVEKLEITNFKCLNSAILKDEELVFEVEAKCDNTRTTLYKFLRLDECGKVTCLQDFSTRKSLSYTETNSGKYKLLCLAKDMYSPKKYDDRAILYYNVKPYKDVIIDSFLSDMSSPQIVNANIRFKCIAQGGKDLRYRFIIEGSKNEDSGYLKENIFNWKPTQCGKYTITLWVKDVSCRQSYEAESKIEYKIDEIPREPVKISDVIVNKREDILIGDCINIKAIAKGGLKLLYSFIIKKDNKQYDKISYGKCNYINFTPEEQGKYEIEVRVRDKYSQKEIDASTVVSINAYEYIPAKIDYILLDPREYYLIGEQIVINVITTDTKNILLKYSLMINGHVVEETDYIKSNRYILTPRCNGKYKIKVYAKNDKSKKEFDSAKEISMVVHEASPIRNTVLKCDRIDFFCNEPISVIAEGNGGKDVIYEFYLMEKGEWNLVQKYSKKEYYSFIPFSKGIYKVLVLAKSNSKQISYEDYCMIEIKVGERIESEKVVLDNIKNLNYAI